MARFRVRWLDAGQGLREALVQAADAAAVPAALGVAPQRLLSVAPADAPAAAGRWRAALAAGLAGRRAPALDLRLFCQELALLLDAGIPLLEALDTLRDKGDGAGRRALDAVLQGLRDGERVSQALARAPGSFDPLTLALVAASERSGQLAVTLRDHAAWLAWSGALAARLRAALVYPALLLGAGGTVVLFLLLYVLPRFAGVFDGLDRDLPAASAALIALGVQAAAHPGVALAAALAVPALALLAWRLPAVQRRLADALWTVPGLGARLRVVALARLYRCLGLLLGAGVPVPQALALCEGVLAPPLRPAGRRVRQQVAAGLRLSQAMDAAGLATPVAQRMLRVGESSGTLATMLARAAAFHDEEIARLADLVTRVVNPVLMLVMGVVIGGIVVLMYLPIFTLMEQVQ